MDCSEFLQGLHPSEPDHCPLAPPEGQVAVFSSIVLPAAYGRLPVLGVQSFQRRAIGAQPVGDDLAGAAMAFHGFLD